MNLSMYAAFAIAATLLILSPGPTVMLVTSTSLRDGRRAGLVAVAGSTLAAAFQLSLVVCGLASIVNLAGNWFELVRWAGVAYLLYLGLSAWFAPSGSELGAGTEFQPRSTRRQNFVQGFLVTLTNPKTLLFHGAFLPQFVDSSLPGLQQMIVLASTFVVIAGVGDSAWAVLAARVGAALKSGRGRRLVVRLSGSVLICAGIVLATVRRAD